MTSSTPALQTATVWRPRRQVGHTHLAEIPKYVDGEAPFSKPVVPRRISREGGGVQVTNRKGTMIFARGPTLVHTSATRAHSTVPLPSLLPHTHTSDKDESRRGVATKAPTRPCEKELPPVQNSDVTKRPSPACLVFVCAHPRLDLLEPILFI